MHSRFAGTINPAAMIMMNGDGGSSGNMGNMGMGSGMRNMNNMGINPAVLMG